MEGNQQKIREALESFVEYSELVCKMGMFNRDRLIAITTKARDALSAQARQCDVGTDEEQAKRFEEFCNSHTCTMGDCNVHKSWRHFFYDCGLKQVSCGLIFAQMPYEAEEGGKE